MTANVITYRSRSAARELGKVLGLPQPELARLGKLLPHFEYKTEDDSIPARAREVGLDPNDRRVQLFLELTGQILNLPRHLGQHSGGMILSRGRLDEVVPLEPASMPGRTVVQWDKDDCADMGIIKVDLLGLGMLAALEKAVPLVRAHEGVEVDLAQLPPGDPAVYGMLQTADTVGVFQVESRAQMATLPRMRPRCFYDLVMEVAIIRPGPITGQMVSPFLERRAGRQPVTYAHPSLEPILQRTLGVPLFQEQLMRMAMVAGNFSGGEADELRRAMGNKRSVERMHKIEERLRAGMTDNGIGPAAQEEIVRGITAFALYGFPESHAASFALIVYASAYLKAHHPQAFLCALLNAWPMGFYSPATLVSDAQRHEVRVLPIDVVRSDWECTLERRGPEEELAVRLGLRYVGGLREEAVRGPGGLLAARERAPFADLGDLAARCALRRSELAALAQLGAFAGLPAPTNDGRRLTRRSALWQAEAIARRGPGMLARVPAREEAREDTGESAQEDAGESAQEEALGSAQEDALGSAQESRPPLSPLREMTARERTAADLRGAGLTVGPHPVAHERARLRAMGAVTARELMQLPNGARARAAGLCIVRQRPGTAKGFVFLSLEDETGIANVILEPEAWARNRKVVAAEPLLVIDGRVQQFDGVTSLKADRCSRLEVAGEAAAGRSRDWR